MPDRDSSSDNESSAGSRADEKARLREHVIAARNGLSEKSRAEAALQLGRNVAAFLDAKGFPEEVTAGVYQSMPGELDLAPTIAMLFASGARVAFPCTLPDYNMEFFALTASELDSKPRPCFIEHPGKRFPLSDCEGLELVKPSEMSLMLVPGVAFDRTKNRLGYGGGCYDRYVQRVTRAVIPAKAGIQPTGCVVMGVCFDEQVVPEIPAEAHDRKMDYVLTPTALY